MLRAFDAVMVVGADAEHLPSRPAEVLFFANAVRRELGLATRESRQRQQLREFASLLLGCPRVVLSWQARRDGESVAPSPWLQRLELALEAACLPSLPRHVPRLAEASLEPVPASMPAPSAPALLPSSLSASGHNSLVACPYQFFASRMLGLRAADELTELPEKRDYGDWLHQILQQYHETLAQAPVPRAERGALMARISDELFAPVLARNPAALGFVSRWTANRDAYVGWANGLEDEGWSFAFGEDRRTRPLTWDGGSLQLIGKLDRVDHHADGQAMVLDYKTSKRNALQDRLKRREDHQLPFYALLLDPAPARAAYVAIDEEKPSAVEADELDAWREALHAQLRDTMAAISSGAPLHASGTAASCAWCEMRGLCRKGAW
jgi:ATP-dependent helicase/nuclease subunit B